MYEEEKAVYHLPTNIAERINYSDSFSRNDKISDQALFDELNAVSEEVVECRNRVLEKIS